MSIASSIFYHNLKRARIRSIFLQDPLNMLSTSQKWINTKQVTLFLGKDKECYVTKLNSKRVTWFRTGWFSNLKCVQILKTVYFFCTNLYKMERVRPIDVQFHNKIKWLKYIAFLPKAISELRQGRSENNIIRMCVHMCPRNISCTCVSCARNISRTCVHMCWRNIDFLEEQ